jgi:hypothetical protein
MATDVQFDAILSTVQSSNLKGAVILELATAF